jgi:GTP cyclohydrolase II
MQPIESWLSQARQHHQKTGRPLVSLSYAQSLDGCLTVYRGQPTALSGPQSSVFTHWLRSAHAAVLVGVNTVLVDNPLLTVRLVEGKSPQPVILDSHLRTPPQARLISERPTPAWIATLENADPARQAALQAAGARLLFLPPASTGQIDLPALLDRLGETGIHSLMVEGGAQVITSFLSQGLADLVAITIAPVFLGGYHAINPNEHWAGFAEHLLLMIRQFCYTQPL